MPPQRKRPRLLPSASVGTPGGSSNTSGTVVREPAAVELDGANGHAAGHAARSGPARMDDGGDDEQIVLSLLYHAHKIGAAYYSSQDCQIHCLGDLPLAADSSNTLSLLRQVRPTQTLVLAKQRERFEPLLRQARGADDASDSSVDEAAEGGGGATPGLELLPSIEFDASMAQQRLLALALPTTERMSEGDAGRYIRSIVDFEAVAMVRCVGALLKYIAKKRVGVELESADTVPVPVLGIRTFALRSTALIDVNTLSALQVFQKEPHPSTFKLGGAKEGLSLYGICNRTKTGAGKTKLRGWFMQPLKDAARIQQRLAAVDFLADHQNLDLSQTLSDYLRRIKGLEAPIKRMQLSHATVSDWLSVRQTCAYAIQIGELSRQFPQRVNAFHQATDLCSEDLADVCNAIDRTMDSDESLVEGRFVVRPLIDDDLDELKRMFMQLPTILTRVATEEFEDLSGIASEIKVNYMAQIGFLTSMPRRADQDTEESATVAGLDFMFFAEGRAYYKTPRTAALDERIGDIRSDIVDAEVGSLTTTTATLRQAHDTRVQAAIMYSLQTAILERASSLLDVSPLVSELDCLLSLSVCAREHHWTKPQVVEDAQTLIIKDGRHPLQELCASPFVPNCTLVEPGDGQILFITGPNASGKSVYIKQVGVIAFLAQVGSFVPAEDATIGIVDAFFSRIQSRESVSVNLSSFAIDINQMSRALKECTRRSLILIDEFGKGTATDDGIGLLCACLDEVAARDKECPVVLVASHFHEIAHQNLLHPSPLISFQRMEILEDQAGDQIVPLYQLTEGYASSSHANHIARRSGVPEAVLARAVEVTDLLNSGRPVSRMGAMQHEQRLHIYRTICQQFMEQTFRADGFDVRQYLSQVLAQAGDT